MNLAAVFEVEISRAGAAARALTLATAAGTRFVPPQFHPWLGGAPDSAIGQMHCYRVASPASAPIAPGPGETPVPGAAGISAHPF